MCYTYDTCGRLEKHNHTVLPHNLTGQGWQYSRPPGDVGQHQANTHPPTELMYEYDSGLPYIELGDSGGVGQIHGMFIGQSPNVRGESLLDQPATDSWQGYQSGYQQPAGDNTGFAYQQAGHFPRGVMPTQPQVFEMPHDNISRLSGIVEGHEPPYKSQRQHGFLPEPSREDDIDLDEDLEARQLARQKQEPSGSSRPAIYNSLPWSSWDTSGNHNPRSSLYADVHQPPGRTGGPTPDVSTETSETNVSSWVVLGRMSSRSSLSRDAQEVMAGSEMTVCPQDLQASVRHDATVNGMLLSPTNPEMLPQGESKAGKHLVARLADLHLLSSKPTNEFLLPPPRSRHSDVTSTTGSSRSTPNIIRCQEPGCRSRFNGRYRQGNYARHKRLKHKGPDPIVCESPDCDKVFQRKDARLKHYRKRHPELARDAISRPKRIEAEEPLHVEIPSVYDREFELFRVGSGLSMQPRWDP